MKRKASGCCTLPEELVIDILSRLPVKSLVQFKCVCKSWHDLLTSRDFVNLHLSRSLETNSGVILLHSSHSLFLASFDFNHPQRPAVELDYPDMLKLAKKYHFHEIVGICNGVVCFEKADVLIFYNPATRECKQVSKPINHTSQFYHDGNLEFAYDCITDDYKVLCITDNYYESSEEFEVVIRETHVYSLKANSWKKMKNPPCGYSVSRTPSVVANNSLYWVCEVKRENITTEVIQRFDLSSETYEEMPFDVQGDSHMLVVLMGRLHTMTYGNAIRIWMLNEDDNHRWIQIFHCSDTRYYGNYSFMMWPLPCAYSKDGHKILVGAERPIDSLICCDLESQTISPIRLLGLPQDDDATFEFISTPWVESLHSLG